MCFQAINVNAAEQTATWSREVDEGIGTEIDKFHFATGNDNTLSWHSSVPTIRKDIRNHTKVFARYRKSSSMIPSPDC